MKTLSLAKAIAFYLAQRRRLGFPLKEEGQMLNQLARFAGQRQHRGPLTRELALAWAQWPSEANRCWWAKRLEAVRRFALFWQAFDPRTQLPPAGVFGPSSCRRAVHLYTPREITTLMQAATALGGLRGASFHTLLGLLACSGMRIGEALRLRPQDIDWTAGVLHIQHAKGRRCRALPLHATALAALKHYHRQRPQYHPATADAPFFLGPNGRAIPYRRAARTFRGVCRELGWTHPPLPRLHDLRHTFAVRSLLDGYRRGEDVAHKVMNLATYLGHTDLQGTYWYLSAVPELLALTQARWAELAHRKGGRHAH
jgi:integrase